VIIPEGNKQRERAFLAEYTDYGIEFLEKKYGRSAEEILAELRRLAPHRIFKDNDKQD
jgi:hypothetical protein